MVVGRLNQEAQLVVIGGGPGGYVAALRAADLGMEVVLVEERDRLGGVCLLEGCIPSKSLIHAVELIDAARTAGEIGLEFGTPAIDLEKLRGWTGKVVEELSRGVDGLLRRRGVEVIHGRARFESDRVVTVQGADIAGLTFDSAIVATGSRINEIPPAYGLPVWSSAEALTLPEVPERLLVVGGGYIGLEMGLVYAGLGSHVTVVDLNPRLLPGADPDLVKVMMGRVSKRLGTVLTDAKVASIRRSEAGYAVEIEQEGRAETLEFGQVLVSAGRRPNTDDLGLEKAGITPDERGFIPVDEQGRTAAGRILAIGDAVPGPGLAHKASREGKVAAEVLAGQPSAMDNRAIPAVVFTDPELAWAGLTETEAAAEGTPVEVGRFPLTALGRARTLGRTDGLVKVIAEPGTGLILGVGMVGPHVSELIAEGTLAIEMGATLEDLAATIHPHPTLSESLMEAAEVAAGTAVHLPHRRGKRG